ncbi:MAG: hypothetical protein LBJ38_00490 [Oscillospiraceae bacterium]|jgi:hypothetical protein|nr:hypothetical protein [Oscillospiraceae bacterium]
MLEKLKEILRPLGIYNLEEGSLVNGELATYAEMADLVLSNSELADKQFYGIQLENLKKLKGTKTFDELDESGDFWSEL